MILIARFYLKKQSQEGFEDYFLEPLAQENTLYDEETMVAWSVIPLVLCANPGVYSKQEQLTCL